jgi:hypothetical protein|tara:strand:+ start:732 stop:986 length:255 start_codon:yes stop_codon:yes gene_type:complete
MNMSKYNRESVEKELKRRGFINRNQQVEAQLTHKLLKGHQKDCPDDWYNEDDNGESDSDRYMEELDQEPWESRTDYCSRMGFDM